MTRVISQGPRSKEVGRSEWGTQMGHYEDSLFPKGSLTKRGEGEPRGGYPGKDQHLPSCSSSQAGKDEVGAQLPKPRGAVRQAHPTTLQQRRVGVDTLSARPSLLPASARLPGKPNPARSQRAGTHRPKEGRKEGLQGQRKDAWSNRGSPNPRRLCGLPFRFAAVSGRAPNPSELPLTIRKFSQFL